MKSEEGSSALGAWQDLVFAATCQVPDNGHAEKLLKGKREVISSQVTWEVSAQNRDCLMAEVSPLLCNRLKKDLWD